MSIGSRKLVRIKPVPIYGKQQEFRQSDAFLRGFVGGRGCVAPETRIGGVPIADIQGGARVSTLCGSQQSLPPFLKGRADLYRVRLRSGLEVVVTDGHRFLTPRGWLPLRFLKESSLVAIGDGSSEDYYLGTGRDWEDRYSLDSRLSDELPSPWEVANRETQRRLCSIRNGASFGHRHYAHLSIEGLTFPRLSRLAAGHLAPQDVPAQSQLACFHGPSRLQPLHDTTDRIDIARSSLVHRCGCDADENLSAFPWGVQECLRGACGSESTWRCNQATEPSGLLSNLALQESESYRSESLSNCAWDEIESITWERKGEFWDLHIPRQNHYSAHGIWHHNTGKTRIGAIDVILRARNGESWLAVSPDSSVILETTWPTFVEVAKEVGTFIKGVKSPYPKATFHTLDGGVAEAVFRSGENPEKLRGPSKAGLWLDEASVMVEDVFLIGLAVLRHKGRMGKCSMTFTPKGRQHWTFHRFFEAVDEDRVRFHDPSRLVEYADQTYHRRHKSHLVHAKSSENPFLPEDYVENIRANYSALFAQQELEGEFVDIQGLLFNRPDFRFIKERDIPRDAVRVRYWDRASLSGSGSYTAGVLMCKTLEHRPRFIIEDVVRGQWSPGERDRIIKETAEMDANKYGNEVLIFVEQEGGSGGKEVADQMVMALAGYPVYRDVVGGTRYRNKDNLRLPGEAKVVRAMPLQSQVEINNVFLKESTWNQDFLEEIVAFPESSHSDQVDATSGAFNKINIKADVGPVSPSNRIEPQTNGIGTRLVELQRRRNRKK